MKVNSTPLKIQSINRVGECTIYKDNPPILNYIGFVPAVKGNKGSFYNLSSGVYQINFFQDYTKGENEEIDGIDLIPTLRSAGVMYVNSVENLIGYPDLKFIPNITVIVPNFVSIEIDSVVAKMISIDYEYVEENDSSVEE